MAKQNPKKLTKQFVGKPLPQVDAVSTDATAVKPEIRQRDQIGNYKQIDSRKSDFIKDYGLPIAGGILGGPLGAVYGGLASAILPPNIKQLGSKLLGDARMSDESLNDEQKVMLWDVIQAAKKRTGTPNGGTEYSDYGTLGLGSSEQYNEWFNRGNIGLIEGAYNSFTNPGFQLGSTVGRGNYFTDPENPDKIYYTDVYDWNPGEKYFSGNKIYQKVRNTLRAGEDQNLNAQKNDNYRMNFTFDAKEIEKLRNKKNGGWLDKYNDGGPIQPNYNDASVSMSDDFVGDGYSNVGRNYSPAWGGQFKDGGDLSFIDSPKLRNMLEGYKPGFMDAVGDYRLPEGYAPPFKDPSSEISTSIGGENGEPAYLIPTFKYGKRLNNPVGEFNITGQHIGGPFKTVEDVEKFGELRHQYVGEGKTLPSPIATSNMAMGGSMPGAVGFMYARTINPAPSKGPYGKKTVASAQNGKTVPGENELIQQPNDQINYDSDNPAFDAASMLIGQGLINSIPEANSPVIDINFNQKNLLGEHTFTHQPGWTGISDPETDEDEQYTNRYMLKRTVSPYTTDEDVRLNTQMPSRPQDVNFISNYANSAGYESKSEYPTKVPYEGEKHWNIDRFVIDPEFSSAYPNLENTKEYTDKTQQRRNTLTDMYKYFMLQNKGDRDVAWKQANEFMTKEIDPRISGPVYDVLHNSDPLGWLAGSITSMIPNEYRRTYDSLLNESKLPEEQRSYIGNEFLKNPASPKRVKDLAMDWLVNYKKMSPKEAETHYNKLPKNEKEYYKQYLKSIKNQDKSERTTLDLSSPGNFQNGGEMKYYQNGLDFKPKSISKDGTWLNKYEQGGQLTKLDQLTNFTNYNTKQPGSWLDKYQ